MWEGVGDMSEIDPRTHEGRRPPAQMPGWREWWGFDFVSPRDDLAGWAELVLFPESETAWYHAFVVGRDRQLVAVVDHEVPMPARTLEIRTHGLWADHICETPGEHWTLGLEAFGVGLDDPAEMYRRQLGDVVPLGFDLEWDNDDPDATLLQITDRAIGGYSLGCEVSGEVLIGDETLDIDATGTRHHRWGSPLATAAVNGFVIPATEVTTVNDPDGLPVDLAVSGRSAVDIVAVTPLAVPDPLGACRRPRAVVTNPERGDWLWADWTEPDR